MPDCNDCNEEDEKKLTFDDLIWWCEWIGKGDRSLRPTENVPLVIGRYLRMIRQRKRRKDADLQGRAT